MKKQNSNTLKHVSNLSEMFCNPGVQNLGVYHRTHRTHKSHKSHRPHRTAVSFTAAGTIMSPG